jgi:hypothetical protein
MPRQDRQKADYFNVDYGLATAAITTGNVAIATTETAYHGIQVVAGTTATAIITIYDSAGGASGSIIEKLEVRAKDARLNERFRPVMARKGLFVVATGTGMSATLFYGPKG